MKLLAGMLCITLTIMLFCAGNQSRAELRELTCKSAEVPFEVVSCYDSFFGSCMDVHSKKRYNKASLTEVLSSKFGECVEIKESFDGHGSISYSGLNLRGADLSEASLGNTSISASDFSGANIINLDFGDATLQGTIDQYTIYSEGKCKVTDLQIICQNS